MVLKKNKYEYLLGALTKSGKKSTAKKILDSALKIVSRKSKLSFQEILNRIFSYLYTSVEIKKVKQKEGFHIVPFPINKKRSYYLIVKWLISSAAENLKRISFKKKLSNEILNLIKNKECRSLKKKRTTIQQALRHRSNMNYRW